LGDDANLTFPDLDTSNPVVRAGLQSYIKSFVQEYSVDGLRIDAAENVEPDFWKSFCNEGGAAGVFCMGEINGTDVQCVIVSVGRKVDPL
jgi:alpha-amylase